VENVEKKRIKSSITVDKKPADVWYTLVEVSNYRSWNPVVKHAAIYGPVSAGTRIKILAGKWDLDFDIVDVSVPERLELMGRTVGLNMELRFILSPEGNGSAVDIEVLINGWISKIFRKKIRKNIEEFFDIFLFALKRRVSSGNTYEIKRDDEKMKDEDHRKGISMPTPFNVVYRTRSKKTRRGRSGLK
jgi:hypothetical protein